MANVRAFMTLRFYAVLPDDDVEADDAFDGIGDAITAVLNQERFPYVVAESFTVEDGTTEPDE